jgi:hypothetical protein
MTDTKTTIQTEEQARKSMVCVGCDRPKSPDENLIVCWDCFKYHCPKNENPFKYADVSFQDWQRDFIKAERL